MVPAPASTATAKAARRVEGFIERTYVTFGGRLYHYLLGLLRSAADAEDAVQTVFVKLAGRQGDDIGDLAGYLFTAARNEASRILDRRRRDRRPEPEEPPPLFEKVVALVMPDLREAVREAGEGREKDDAEAAMAPLARLEGVWAPLDAAFARPSCVFPVAYNEGFDATLNHLPAFAPLARALQIRAQVRLR